MALSQEDLNTIKLTIVDTLNGRLNEMDASIKETREIADKANVKIIALISFLAGSGVIGGAGYGLFRAFG